MVGAMLVLLAVIAAFVVFRELNRNEVTTPVRTVEYRQTAVYAAEQVDFELLAPSRLPEGWRATSVSFTPEPSRWHIGQLTADDEYVGLEQSRASSRDMVETYVDENAVRRGAVQAAGTTWTTWTDAGGDTALVAETGDATTLVVGPVDRDVLVDYVELLAPPAR